MTPAGKLGFEPDLDDIQSNGNPNYSCTETENIGVIVFSAHSGGEGLMAKCCPNVPVPVGGYRHPDTRPTDQNTMRTEPILDCRTDLVGNVRIIDRFLGITPQIDDRMVGLFKQLDQLSFKSKSAMVTPQCNIQVFAP